MAWQRTTFAIGPEDRVAQLAGCGFDVVMRDLFLPLTSGALLCLPPETAEPAAPQTLRWLTQEGITLFHVVPGIVQHWLADVEPDLRLPRLRWIFLAGEALSEALVQRWRAAFPESGPIVNFYGPTETTLIKSYHVVDGEPLSGIQPVGRPLPQTQLLILNAAGRLCGIGEPGEIVIRTPFRALGYINAAEEQRLRYVPNPFRADPNDLLYRTGDRGRYRPDGAVTFLGRLDDQVKIRGVRVEPGEVTAVLGRDPRVAACCVVARPDAQGEPALVAYVVAAAAPLAAADLRAALALQLPSVLVPAQFVFLDALPLLPNGKVNRSALPAPAAPAPAAAPVPPRTENERILADLWGELLQRPAPGVNENFFELGGHSLLAMRLVAHIRQALQVEIPLRKVFEYPTIEGLALCVLEQQARAAPGGLEALLNEVAPARSDGTR